MQYSRGRTDTPVDLGTAFAPHTGSVLHLDYAIPLKDRDTVSHYQWLLKLQQSF